MQRWADARRARMNAEEDAAAAATTATTTRAPTRSPRPGRWRGGAPADEYAYVSCMCVADAYRRRGIADALMNAAEEITLRWGYDVACLHVYQRNAGAIALYRRRGYEIVDDGCPPFDAMLGKRRFLMMKRLRGRVVGEEYQDID
jgi:GNAT superfamily N-acetyltransferase